MNVPFLVSNILSGVGMCAMLASTALRSRRKILAVQSVNHALSMAACSLLRGWSGAVQEAVNLVRDLAVLLFGKLNRFWQIFFVAAALGLGAAVTFAGGFQWYGLLTMLNSETVAQLIMSALVSGVTIAGKACGKNIATGKATQIVHTTSKLIYYIKSLFTGKLPKKKKK